MVDTVFMKFHTMFVISLKFDVKRNGTLPGDVLRVLNIDFYIRFEVIHQLAGLW